MARCGQNRATPRYRSWSECILRKYRCEQMTGDWEVKIGEGAVSGNGSFLLWVVWRCNAYIKWAQTE